MYLNPQAVVFWGFLAGIGYLINDVNGAVTGFVVGFGISIVAEFLD